ncbi:MAG: 50S ribosomal protein L17 [Luteibaculum sp.]
MRHGKKVNHLSRQTGHRKAMLANMTVSLIEHKRISTTLAKAKALRTYAEPILTKAKDDSTHSRRVVFSYLKNKDAVTELFREIAPKIADRPGGYLRIIKTGTRLGDNSEMCLIELVDFNELYTLDKKAGGKKKRSRRGRGGAKKTADTASTDTVVVEDEAKAESTAKPEPKKAPAAKAESKKEDEVKAEAKPKTEAKDAPAADSNTEEGSEEKKD